MKLLLDLGANINLVGSQWGCALGVDACMGKITVVKLLLDRGANIDFLGASMDVHWVQQLKRL